MKHLKLQEAYIRDRNKVPPEFKFKCEDYVKYIGDIREIENEIAIVKTVDDGATSLTYFIEFMNTTIEDAYKKIWASEKELQNLTNEEILEIKYNI